MVARIVVARSVGRLGGRSGLPGLTGALPLIEIPPNAPPSCVFMHHLSTAYAPPNQAQIFICVGVCNRWCLLVHCGALVWCLVVCAVHMPVRHATHHYTQALRQTPGKVVKDCGNWPQTTATRSNWHRLATTANNWPGLAQTRVGLRSYQVYEREPWLIGVGCRAV